MIVSVHQTITIHSLRIDSLSNSSILQIGSAGLLKGLSNNFNTGGFTGPAPQAQMSGQPSSTPVEIAPVPLVPLPALG